MEVVPNLELKYFNLNFTSSTTYISVFKILCFMIVFLICNTDIREKSAISCCKIIKRIQLSNVYKSIF